MATGMALRILWNRLIKWVAYPALGVVLFLAGYALGVRVCRSAAYKQGYEAGFSAPVCSDSLAAAQMQFGYAFKSVYRTAGIAMDGDTMNGWYLASFSLVPAFIVEGHYDGSRHDSTLLVPIFEIRSRAIPGRWYSAASDGSASYVDR